MPVGTVKRYDPANVFGFIAPEDGGGDLFVRQSVVGTETLAEGDRIEFTAGVGLKGERAERIRVLERSELTARERRQAVGQYPSFGRSAIDPSLLPRATGVVRRFESTKGFGFIAKDDGDDDVFFHGSAVMGNPVREGDRVEFRLGRSAKGPRAEQVRAPRRVGGEPSTDRRFDDRSGRWQRRRVTGRS